MTRTSKKLTKISFDVCVTGKKSRRSLFQDAIQLCRLVEAERKWAGHKVYGWQNPCGIAQIRFHCAAHTEEWNISFYNNTALSSRNECSFFWELRTVLTASVLSCRTSVAVNNSPVWVGSIHWSSSISEDCELLFVFDLSRAALQRDVLLELNLTLKLLTRDCHLVWHSSHRECRPRKARTNARGWNQGFKVVITASLNGHISIESEVSWPTRNPFCLDKYHSKKIVGSTIF